MVRRMTAPPATEQPLVAKRSRHLSRTAVLIVGVLVIPAALSIALNNYGALTVDGAIRMAFATVAGQTIAILSAITVIILTVRRRYALPAIAATVIIAAVITVVGISNMATAADLLLTRLDIIAHVDELNR